MSGWVVTEGGMHDWMDGWMDEGMDGWTDGRMDRRIDGSMDRWMVMDQRVEDTVMGGWTGRWKKGLMGRWMG